MSDPNKKKYRRPKIAKTYSTCPKDKCVEMGELIAGAYVDCPTHGLVSVFEKIDLSAK